jgi:hypothetical protein
MKIGLQSSEYLPQRRKGRKVGPNLSMRNFALCIVLLVTVASGCSSVISNSERFYQDRPRRPINWREYLTD